MQVAELLDAWPQLNPGEQLRGFRELNREDAEAFVPALPALEAAELLEALPATERKTWMRLLAPDGQLAAIAHAESPGWYHPEVVLAESVPPVAGGEPMASPTQE